MFCTRFKMQETRADCEMESSSLSKKTGTQRQGYIRSHCERKHWRLIVAVIATIGISLTDAAECPFLTKLGKSRDDIPVDLWSMATNCAG